MSQDLHRTFTAIPADKRDSQNCDHRDSIHSVTEPPKLSTCAARASLIPSTDQHTRKYDFV